MPERELLAQVDFSPLACSDPAGSGDHLEEITRKVSEGSWWQPRPGTHQLNRATRCETKQRHLNGYNRADKPGQSAPL